MITGKLIDRNVKLICLLCLPEGTTSSKILLLVAVLAIVGALTGCADAHIPLLTSIQVTPANSTIDIGQTQQFTAIGTFSDGNTRDLTNLVTWSSSNTTVATISSSGLALGHGPGSTMISATFNTADGAVTGAAAERVVVTLQSVTITPVDPSIANGTSLQLTATGIFSDGSTQNLTATVSWTSSSNAIAMVSSSGLLTGTGVGSATITATQAGVSGATTVTVTAAVLTSITITPPNPSIAKGTSAQLIATGNFSDGTTEDFTAFVTWTSSAPALATVSNAAGSQGLVTGSGVGASTITATLAGVSDATTLTVTHPVLIAIVVSPANPSIANGTTEQLKATGAFSDGSTQDLTTQVSWTSASGAIATVSSSGLLTGTGVGSATVTATQAGVSGVTTVTVTAAVLTSIAITPANSSIAKGTSEQLIATGTFSDGTTKVLTASVTWVSSDPTLATVSDVAGSQGLVTGTGVGSATITATQAGVSGSTAVAVTAAVVTSIAVAPANQSIANGDTVQLIATGTFSDGTTKDLTTQVSWISSSDEIATVGNTVSPGLVTGTGVGSAMITATLHGVTGSTTVSVVSACSIGDGATVAAYNAIPFGAINCSPASWSFEAGGVSEFGDEVGLAASTGTTLVSLNVLFVSFGCSDSGHWYDGCLTTPGATFNHPITANIYDVNNCSGTPCPGALLATVTQTQTIPYRPSADGVNCPNDPAQWFNPLNMTSPGGCQSGISKVLTFTFTSPVQLPNQVIFTVAFNTTHSGAMPIGQGAPCFSTAPGCPYDSLNVGVRSYPGAPYAGTDIDPNGVFQNSASPGAYCDNGVGGTDFLRLDTACWTGFRPLGEVITN